MDEKPSLKTKRDFDPKFSDECLLYRFAHNQYFDDDRIPKSTAFKPDFQFGISCDWSKLSTPEDTLIRVGLTYKFESSLYKDFQEFSVIQFSVAKIKTIDEIIGLKHTPKKKGLLGHPKNLSHSTMYHLDVEVRIKLKGISQEVEFINRKFVKEIVEKNRK